MTEEKRRRTILIVDDEPAIRELLKVQLAGEGYEVVMAEDARSAARLTELVARVLRSQERLYAAAGIGHSSEMRKALGAA